MSVWKLTLNGVTKSLAEWRVQNVSLRRQNLAGDLLTFTAPRATFSESPLLAFGDVVTLLRTTNGQDVIWFTGTNRTTPETAEAAGYVQSFTIASPWRWLAENVFQQPWYNASIYTSHIITVGTVGNNIKAVLDYAIAQSPGLLRYEAADLALLAALPPTNEFTEKTCDQVIREQLQFAPDTVVWFDYTTTPPTLRFVQRGSLAAVSLRMAGYDDATKEKVAVSQLVARPDLQIPSAKINFEIIEEIDGVQRLIPSTDIYPPTATGREDGAFNATLTIQGRSVQNVTGQIECATIDYTSLAWWKRHVPALADNRVTVIAGPRNTADEPTKAYNIEGVEIALPLLLPRELVGGQIAPWMTEGGVPIEWQKVTLKARFAVQFTNDGETLRVEDSKEYSIELMTTDAPDGISTYSATASVDSGDGVPVGLAQYLYTSLSELHYQGAFSLIQSQCDGVVNLGNVVNLYGARPEHQTMRALVQEMEFDIDNGVTRVQMGPPRHLGLSDLLALLQRFRVRRRWTNPDTQDTGDFGGGSGDLALGKATPNNAGGIGEGAPSLFTVLGLDGKVTLDGDAGAATVLSPSGTTIVLGGKVDVRQPGSTCVIEGAKIDLAGPGSVVIDAAAAAGHPMSIKAFDVCVDGQKKKALFLCSDIY